MGVTPARLDGENIGLTLDGGTLTVDVLACDLTTGALSSAYLSSADLAFLAGGVAELFSLVPFGARVAGSGPLRFLTKLVQVAPADGSTMSVSAPLLAGTTYALRASVVASPAYLVAHLSHSIVGAFTWAGDAVGGGGGGGSGLIYNEEVNVPSDMTHREETGFRPIAGDTDFVVNPQGVGALVMVPRIENSGLINLDERGNRAVDLQGLQSNPDEVASGNCATIVGGRNSIAFGENAGIVGGITNKVFAANAIIAGGASNLAGIDPLSTDGIGSGILGGGSNQTIGSNAGIIGGESNLVEGGSAVALGGLSNQVDGQASTATGFRGKAWGVANRHVVSSSEDDGTGLLPRGNRQSSRTVHSGSFQGTGVLTTDGGPTPSATGLAYNLVSLPWQDPLGIGGGFISAYHVTATVTAIDALANAKSWRLEGLALVDPAGVFAWAAGAPTSTVLFETGGLTAGWQASLQSGAVPAFPLAFYVGVNGNANVNDMSWSATVETTESSVRLP